jgi:hypothetical protein
LLIHLILTFDLNDFSCSVSLVLSVCIRVLLSKFNWVQPATAAANTRCASTLAEVSQVELCRTIGDVREFGCVEVCVDDFWKKF